MILAALGGGAYYFREDIMKQLGMDQTKKEEQTEQQASEKEEVKEASKPVEKSISMPELPKPVKTEVAAAVQNVTAVVQNVDSSAPVDYKAVRQAIVDLLEDEK